MEYSGTEPGRSLHGLFEAQAARTPRATAVVSAAGSCDYGALDSRAADLAVLLAGRGAGPGELVAVAMERSVGLVAALFAVLKTGAAFLPIDPGYPAERIAQILTDARPSVIVTDAATAPRLGGGSAYAAATVVLEREPDAARGTSPGEAGREPRPDEAAYVVYTSGSTGRPKGVVISHRAIVNYLSWQLADYPLDADDRVLQKAPVGFDGAVLEFFLPLSAGATLVLAGPGQEREPERTAALIEREQITVAQFVPSMLPVLLEDQISPLCKSLRRVYSASDALPGAVEQRFLETFDAELVNLYGPTEATVDAAHWRCVPVPGAPPPPVGRAVRDMRVEVLDARLRRAAPGEEGEIYLAGVQLARGYLGRPGLTAERFPADPHGAPGTRMYRTGDLGRLRADGVLEFIGRVDNQVKIRGVRVEPAEIEAALADHPGVRLSAAKAVRTPAGSLRLAAYVVPAQAGALTAAEVRAYLRERLPDAAVPSYVLFLDELPLTPNEKLDRAALPAPEFVAADGADADAGGGQSDEEVFYRVVREVLGVPRAGAHDGFIELGGDSISAIQLASRARQSGLAVTTGDVLRRKTLGDLLAAARTGAAASDDGDSDGVGRLSRTPIMRWLRELGGPVDSFSQSMVLTAPADTTHDELLACLQALLDRHDMLRARFAGDLVAEVLERGAVDAATCLDVVEVDDAAGDEELRLLVRGALEAARDRLACAQGRLVRAIWLRRGNGEAGRLAVLVHHLAIDGVSLRVLQADLADAWRSLRTSGTPHVPAVAVSFRRWAGLLEQDALSARRRSELGHWLAVTDGRTEPLADRGLDPDVDTLGAAGVVRLELPPEQTEALLGRAPGILGQNVNALLITGLALAVTDWRAPATAPAAGRTAGRRDLLIAMEGHGREPVFPGVDPGRTVGWFTTLFPVRIGLEDTDPRRAVARVGAQLDAIADKGFGYGLLRYLNPDTAARLADRTGRPELLFNYLGRFTEGEGADWGFAPGHDVAMDEADPAMRLAFPIEVNCLTVPRGDGQALCAVWQFSRSLFEHERIAALARGWFGRLAEIAALADERPAVRLTPHPFDHDDFETDLRAF